MKKQADWNKLTKTIKNRTQMQDSKTNKNIKRSGQTGQVLKMGLMLALIGACFWGCGKESLSAQGAEKTVKGTVFEDCQGNVAQSRKIYLYYTVSGCFGGSVISRDSTLTDEQGRFTFRYRDHAYEASTDVYSHLLAIPNSSIRLYNPDGDFDLYPNETKMNAVIHLKFRTSYTSADTFYFQYRPTPDGIVQEPELVQFFTGPFHDTTLVLNNLTIGNSNNKDQGKFYSGFFKWGIGIRRLNRYYTGQDGYFDLTHQPCARVDTFEYHADPI